MASLVLELWRRDGGYSVRILYNKKRLAVDGADAGVCVCVCVCVRARTQTRGFVCFSSAFILAS